MTTTLCECKTESDTFYSNIKCLALISKLFSTFPLMYARKNDGRELKHSYFSFVYLYGIIAATIFLFSFVLQCLHLLKPIQNPTEDEITLRIWLTLTCYVVTIRGIIQFLVVHGMAGRFPALFKELEEYYQVIGVNIVKIKKRRKWAHIFFNTIWTLMILAVLQSFTVFFFLQLNPDLNSVDIIGVANSYMGANIWKELPMNMFAKIIVQITRRFDEIKEELKKLREKTTDKDMAKDLERLRLQHAALIRIVTLLQRCYGLQLAVNFSFLIIEIVLQLFVFFIITNSSNVFLLGLAFYYLLMGSILLAIVDRVEQKDQELLQEIAAFEVCTSTHDQQLQIQLFTAQITARPIKLSASGFFNVNNAFLCSVLGGVATYLVMMVQFTPYISQQSTEHHGSNSTAHHFFSLIP